MSLKFIAPVDAINRPFRYATYVPSAWRPSLRVHRRMTDAKNSLAYRAGARYSYYTDSLPRTWRENAVLIEFVEGEMFVLASWTTEDLYNWKKWDKIPTGEDYVAWRIAVDRELRGEGK